MALHSPAQKIGVVAAQAVAAIATVELPNGQWPELIEILLGFVNNANNTPLRIATLNAIGYICESIVRFFTTTRSPKKFSCSYYDLSYFLGPRGFDRSGQRNFDRRRTWGQERRAFVRGAACRNSSVVQLPDLHSGQL